MSINVEVIKTRIVDLNLDVKKWVDEVEERSRVIQDIIEKEGINFETLNLKKTYFQMLKRGAENFNDRINKDVLCFDLSRYGASVNNAIINLKEVIHRTFIDVEDCLRSLEQHS